MVNSVVERFSLAFFGPGSGEGGGGGERRACNPATWHGLISRWPRRRRARWVGGRSRRYWLAAAGLSLTLRPAAARPLPQNFMEHIDAIDNGVDVAEGPLKYDVSSHLSARVATLNPR